jgi:hypothetical protein
MLKLSAKRSRHKVRQAPVRGGTEFFFVKIAQGLVTASSCSI